MNEGINKIQALFWNLNFDRNLNNQLITCEFYSQIVEKISNFILKNHIINYGNFRIGLNTPLFLVCNINKPQFMVSFFSFFKLNYIFSEKNNFFYKLNLSNLQFALSWVEKSNSFYFDYVLNAFNCSVNRLSNKSIVSNLFFLKF